MIPVRINPFFWVTAALIGWLNSGTFSGALIWIGIIFVSVLFHEFGHALTAVMFGQKANIQLVALGGLTSYDGPKLKFWQQFVIVFNGPLFGFLLFVAATLLLQIEWPPIFALILKLTQYANLFWTIVNLFPVLPLDGGQLLRIVLESWFGVKGYKASLMVGAILSALVAIGFFAIQGFLIGALFFLFAYQSFDLWRKSKSATMQDRDDELRKVLMQGEEAAREGRKDEAERLFLEVKEKTKEGLFHKTAMQYLAFLKWQTGQRDEAYDLLLPIEEDLTDDARVLLHELAADHKNWALVAKLSTECYQVAPSPQMALNNARAFAFLKQPKFAGGWLQTAMTEGIEIGNVLNEDEFQAIKHDPEFQHFIR